MTNFKSVVKYVTVTVRTTTKDLRFYSNLE